MPRCPCGIRNREGKVSQSSSDHSKFSSVSFLYICSCILVFALNVSTTIITKWIENTETIFSRPISRVLFTRTSLIFHPWMLYRVRKTQPCPGGGTRFSGQGFHAGNPAQRGRALFCSYDDTDYSSRVDARDLCFRRSKIAGYAAARR